MSNTETVAIELHRADTLGCESYNLLSNGQKQAYRRMAMVAIKMQSKRDMRLTEIAAAKATRCDELFEELERVAPDSPLLEKIRNEAESA